MITATKPFSFAATLTCSNCQKEYSLSGINTYAVCCEQPLVVEYEYPPGFLKKTIQLRQNNIWRYAEMLPVIEEKNIVSLGEGMTPIFPLNKLGDQYGFSDLLIKDESSNPTGSFKARGLSVAVSKAKEFGITNCIIPTAGNAGGALAAYCAKANIKCTVVMPTHTPAIFKQECKLYGAEVILIDGLINDCAKKVMEISSDANLAKQLGTNGRNYVKEYFNRNTIATKLLEQLKQL